MSKSIDANQTDFSKLQPLSAKTLDRGSNVKLDNENQIFFISMLYSLLTNSNTLNICWDLAALMGQNSFVFIQTTM